MRCDVMTPGSTYDRNIRIDQVGRWQPGAKLFKSLDDYAAVTE